MSVKRSFITKPYSVESEREQYQKVADLASRRPPVVQLHYFSHIVKRFHYRLCPQCIGLCKSRKSLYARESEGLSLHICKTRVGTVEGLPYGKLHLRASAPYLNDQSKLHIDTYIRIKLPADREFCMASRSASKGI